MIKIENLNVYYDNKLVLDNISLDINKGDYISIIGENGSGKSTLIKAILDLVPIKSGNITTNLKPCMIGYLPQQTEVIRNFPASVYEVILSGCTHKNKFFYSKDDKNRVLDIIEKLNISDIKNKSYKELSGGQAQRVLLARALLHSSEVLILDEPVNGLDPLITSELYSIIKNLNNSGVTIIMVSHDVKSALTDATKILHMGRSILFYGEKDKYINSDISRKFMWCTHE